MHGRARSPASGTSRQHHASGQVAHPAPSPDHPLLGLQAQAGNQAVAAMLAGAGGDAVIQRSPADAPAKGRRRRPVSGRRQRAAALGAPDATELIGRQLPEILTVMTAAQVEQVQRVIDAAAINPGIDAKIAALGSGAKQYGSLTIRDPKVDRQADRLRAEYVPVSDGDRRLRLNHEPLLGANVFDRTVVNPDEARFVAALRARLASSGVWLRINDLIYRRSDDGNHMERTSNAELWLSLGPDGDHIPAPGGKLTKDALLGTTALGAMWYSMLQLSPARQALERESKRLESAILDGMLEHGEQKAARDNPLVPYVPELIELIGGADFPDPNIWQAAWTLYTRSAELLGKDQTEMARPLLVAAGWLTASAARSLGEYQARVQKGGAIAVKWASRVELAAEVVEAVLTGAAFLEGAGVVAVRTAATEEVTAVASRAPGWRYIGKVGEEPIWQWEGGPAGTKTAGRWLPRGERGHVSTW